MSGGQATAGSGTGGTNASGRTFDAVVIHSGGMDSSICLAVARQEFGADRVLSLAFDYGQRHRTELEAAKLIAAEFGTPHVVVPIACLREITSSALLDASMPIEHEDGAPPNTMVVGRNGLFVRVGAIHAHHLGARCIYAGIIEVEAANSGYRDCTRKYMDLVEKALRLDFDDPGFEVRTPVVRMTKLQTMELAARLGVLELLLRETVTCYEGVKAEGCGRCPACLLRAEGVRGYREGRTG